MKILLVSDTHGNNEILDQLYKEYPNMDLYLHAGDSEAYHQTQLGPFVSVKGNCDHYMDLPDSFSFPTPFGQAIMKHKPFLSERDKIGNLKIFIHGHTHANEINFYDGIYHICPGSISYSRKGKESFMLLTIKENSITLTLIELENKTVLYTREIL